jgi:carboxymethylenebutenolidase
MKSLSCLAFLLLASFCAHAQDADKARLEASPRHGEWVTVKSGGRDLKCFVVYPEVKDKAPAVLVIHEIFGLTDWARGVCDDLAAAGYIAIAPDLLSGQTYSGIDEARKLVGELPPAQVTSDLEAAAAYVTKLPAANGTLSVAGFCWGGGQSFAYATVNPKLKAAFVFYGPSPDAGALSKIACPVYGFYGEDDARISAGVPATTEQMKTAGKTYEPVIYAGAGHGFMRTGEAPDATPGNKAARTEAWQRWKKILGSL